MIEPGRTRVRTLPGALGTIRVQVDGERVDVDWDDGISTVVRLDACELVPHDQTPERGTR